MALFRKKDPSTMPDEVQQYYSQSRRDRTWVAWLLAIATMVVTIIVALGLFYGGRWLYRQLFKSNDTTTTETTSTEDANKQGQGTQSESTPEPTSQPSSGTSSTNTSQPSNTQQPTTGPSSPEPLPRTGPDQDL